MNQVLRIRVLGAFAGLLCGAVGCGGYDSSGNGAALMLAPDARVGSHLIDGSGRSLYYFGKDLPASGSNATPELPAASGITTKPKSSTTRPGPTRRPATKDAGTTPSDLHERHLAAHRSEEVQYATRGLTVGFFGCAGWIEMPSRVHTLITCADKNALP